MRNTADHPCGVVVEEGRVWVASATDAGTLGTAAATGVASWRDGRITLDNLQLSRALAQFERYGPRRLVVPDPAVAALRVSGTFDSGHL